MNADCHGSCTITAYYLKFCRKISQSGEGLSFDLWKVLVLLQRLGADFARAVKRAVCHGRQGHVGTAFQLSGLLGGTVLQSV